MESCRRSSVPLSAAAEAPDVALRAFRGVAAVVGVLLAAAPLSAQQPAHAESGPGTAQPVSVEAVARPVAHAVRTNQRIVIDGEPDEAAWQEADSLDDFVQSQPAAGYPATEPTVVRLLYDDEYLYISALCFDSDVESMVIATVDKDLDGASTRDYDLLAFAFDTFLDRKNSFMFAVNPLGGVRDAQTFDDAREVNFSWDGVHQARTRLHDWGWSLEMAIPWTTLRFDPSRADQTWGMNLLRRVRRKSEDSYWAPLDRRDPIHKMSKAGTLDGLRGLHPSRNLMLTPYVSAGSTSGLSVPGADRGERYDAGFDLKYGLTPQVTLDLTYNTDFSQVEVDQEQVNLTRFSLFFPEKRDFFVENSGFFTFGDVSEREYRMGASLRDFTLFHSRRIGLQGGQPVPIVGGGRLSGRLGGFEIGILDMQTEATPVASAENFAVARLRRSLFGAVDVGGIVVNRQETDGGDYNRSWGVDASAHLLGNLIVSSYLAGTDDAGAEEGASTAMRLNAGWRDRLWDVSAMHKRVGAAFDPGVGYIRRRAMNQTYATVGAHPRPDLPGVQQMNVYAEGEYITDPRSVLETRTATGGVGVTFLDGAALTLSASDRFERLYAPFAISGGGRVPAGDHGFREGTLTYSSSQGRALYGDVSVGGGGYFNGDRLSLGAGASWRPHYRFAVELRADHNDIGLPEGDYTVDVYGARVRYSHSPRLGGSAYVQYNQALEQLVGNFRLNLVHAPLSDFFLVYTERRGLGGVGVQERLLSAKLTRMVAF